MCGICGIFNKRTEPLAGNAKVSLQAMTDALTSRGPDEEGFLVNGAFAFGHRRLRVIDLEGGRQPMRNEDGSVSLVYNGEIYNFLKIRKDLEKKGRVFRTHSDTESLLKLYEERGIECLNEIEGMFAFALYDRRSDRMYLATDRFGKKPLYYTEADGHFIFASEIKSLLKHPHIVRRIDPKALAQYFMFEYVPAPLTIFEKIHKLEAGTYLEVSRSGIRKESYHQFSFNTETVSEAEWVDRFRKGLRDSVERRLVSDVPLGIFLSGGLDSSSVLAMAKGLEPNRAFKTFTITFDERSYDESHYAKLVSKYFKTEHITERCTIHEMLKTHEQIIEYLDEPMADASFIPTYMLCRLARKHVTVALSGDGGDELFMGYPTFYAHRLAQSLDRIPGILKSAMRLAANLLPTSHSNISLDFKAKQFCKGLSYKPFYRDQIWLGAFSEKEINELLVGDFDKGIQEAAGPIREFLAKLPADSEDLAKLQAFYFNFYLQGDILVKVDRASMANSLEVRSPLLDDTFVRSMLPMPPALKWGNAEGKYLYRKAMKGLIPDTIIHRKKKGFGIPISDWIRKDLKKEFAAVLGPEALRETGIFNPYYVSRLLNEHWAGKKNHRKKLWALYVFERWRMRYLVSSVFF